MWVGTGRNESLGVAGKFHDPDPDPEPPELELAGLFPRGWPARFPLPVCWDFSAVDEEGAGERSGRSRGRGGI